MSRSDPRVRELAGCAGEPLLYLVDGSGAENGSGRLREFARGFSAGLGRCHVSRSYAPPYALIAAHGARVGVDVERDAAWSDSEAASVLAPGELGLLTRETRLSSVWSAKEALAKALGDAVGYDPRRLIAPCWWPAGVAGRWRARPVAELPDGHVGWLCWESSVHTA